MFFSPGNSDFKNEIFKNYNVKNLYKYVNSKEILTLQYF